MVRQAVASATFRDASVVIPPDRPEQLLVNMTLLPRRLEELRIRFGQESRTFKLALANFLDTEAARLREEASLLDDVEGAG